MMVVPVPGGIAKDLVGRLRSIGAFLSGASPSNASYFRHRMQAPAITVLITLYNKGPFVQEAVGSVLAQTFTDFELLVVDDGSTDDGPRRINALNDPRIRLLLSERNTGRPAAANRGYDAAKGKYIAVMDADDLMHPERLAKHHAFLEAHPEVGAVGSQLPAFGGDSRTYATPSDDAACRAIMLFGMPVTYGATTFRRSVIEAYHLRCDVDWRLPGMDYLFVLKVGAHAAYANLQEPLTRYRVGDQNMRHGRDPVPDALALYTEVLARHGLPHDADSVRAHLLLQGTFGLQGDPALVKRTAAWMDILRSWNLRNDHCPAPVFEAELAKRWERLYHALVDRSLAAALMHAQCTPGMRWRHTVHALRRTLQRRS